MKYRRIPIEVDAEQWFPGKLVRGVREMFAYGPGGRKTPYGYGVCKNNDIVMRVQPGDWVITLDGHNFYTCPDDTFPLVYEPVIVGGPNGCTGPMGKTGS